MTKLNRAAVAREYADRYPRHSIRGITSMMYKENKELWPNLDAAYTCMKRVTMGIKNGHGQPCIPASKTRPKTRCGKAPEAPPPIPQSIAQPWEPVPLHAKRILILSDIHLPYHDGPALEAALKAGDALNPDAVLLNGDVVDFYGISRYQTDPRKRSLKAEIDSVRQFLAHLRARFRKARILFKLGNHEERWWPYLWSKAPELLGCDFMDLTVVFDTGPNRVELITDQRIIMLGKLPILHGHELPKGMTNPVNPARGAFLRAIDIALIGHHHRSSEHTETSMLGSTITCWSTGCLCDLHPEYARINRWNHGFAMVEMNGDDFTVSNKRIRHGRVL